MKKQKEGGWITSPATLEYYPHQYNGHWATHSHNPVLSPLLGALAFIFPTCFHFFQPSNAVKVGLCCFWKRYNTYIITLWDTSTVVLQNECPPHTFGSIFYIALNFTLMGLQRGVIQSTASSAMHNLTMNNDRWASLNTSSHKLTLQSLYCKAQQITFDERRRCLRHLSFCFTYHLGKSCLVCGFRETNPVKRYMPQHTVTLIMWYKKIIRSWDL